MILSSSSQRDKPVDAILIAALENKIIIPVLLDKQAKNNWIWLLIADHQAVTRTGGELIKLVAMRVMEAVTSTGALGVLGLWDTYKRDIRFMWIASSTVVASFLFGSGSIFLFNTNLALRTELATSELALDRTRVNLLTRLAVSEELRGNPDSAVRFAAYSVRLAIGLEQGETRDLEAHMILASAIPQSVTQLAIKSYGEHASSASFSPDSRRIVTVSDNGSTRIWDAETGRLTIVLTEDGNRVSFAAWSPDGRQIVTVSDDGSTRIWDAETGRLTIVLTEDGNGVSFAAWSPDGRQIVTVSDDGSARVWAVDSRALMIILGGHRGKVTYAAWSPDGKRILTVSDDGSSLLWDVRSVKEILELRSARSLSYAAWSPEGTRIVAVSRDNLVSDVDVTTDVVKALGNNTAQIWDTATGRQIIDLWLPSDVIYAGWSLNGKAIKTISSNGNVQSWNSSSPEGSPRDLLTEVCTRRLAGATRLTRNEMRLAGYPDSTPEIDVCEHARSAHAS